MYSKLPEILSQKSTSGQISFVWWLVPLAEAENTLDAEIQKRNEALELAKLAQEEAAALRRQLDNLRRRGNALDLKIQVTAPNVSIFLVLKK